MPLRWWAYRHTNGSILVKRFIGDYEDLNEAGASPFVADWRGPYVAKDLIEAEEIARELLSGTD